jgi:hypothetical protein
VNPRLLARTLAAGRIILGLGLLAAPARVGAGWLGELAERPAVGALLRLIGARDLVLGAIALHTIDHPEVGPRWQATCAVVDSSDVLATLAARSDLPPAGAAGTVLLAGVAAAVGGYCSRALRSA